MNKAERKTWLVYGGIVGAGVASLLGLAVVAWMMVFRPQSVFMSWAELPIVILIAAPSGIIMGAWMAHELAQLSKEDRREYVLDLVKNLPVFGVLFVVTRWVQLQFWPKVEPQNNFPVALLWELVPLVPVVIYDKWLRHKIRRKR